MLTHSCSLGYNGAVLQALAVHLSLQGALDLPQQFISKLITEMEEVEDDEVTRNDARMWVAHALRQLSLQIVLGVTLLCCEASFNTTFLSSLKEAEKPFCERLHRVRDLMERSKVSIEEVISELGQHLLRFHWSSLEIAEWNANGLCD